MTTTTQQQHPLRRPGAVITGTVSAIAQRLRTGGFKPSFKDNEVPQWLAVVDNQVLVARIYRKNHLDYTSKVRVEVSVRP